MMKNPHSHFAAGMGGGNNEKKTMKKKNGDYGGDYFRQANSLRASKQGQALGVAPGIWQ